MRLVVDKGNSSGCVTSLMNEASYCTPHASPAPPNSTRQWAWVTAGLKPGPGPSKSVLVYSALPNSTRQWAWVTSGLKLGPGPSKSVLVTL